MLPYRIFKVCRRSSLGALPCATCNHSPAVSRLYASKLLIILIMAKVHMIVAIVEFDVTYLLIGVVVDLVWVLYWSESKYKAPLGTMYDPVAACKDMAAQGRRPGYGPIYAAAGYCMHVDGRPTRRQQVGQGGGAYYNVWLVARIRRVQR